MKEFAMRLHDPKPEPPSATQANTKAGSRRKPILFYAFVAFVGGFALFVAAMIKLHHASTPVKLTARADIGESLEKANKPALPMEFRLQALIQAEREILREANPEQARKKFGEARKALKEIAEYYPDRTPEQQRLYIATLERMVEWGWLAGGEVTPATSSLLTQLATERDQLHITR